MIGIRPFTAALRKFVDLNERVSLRLRDRLFAAETRPCPLADFSERRLRQLLRPEMRVLDAGGGKWPRIAAPLKNNLGLHVTGLDLSADELSQAPAGAYDDTIIGDAANVPLRADYDLVVSQTLLEHVRDVELTIRNFASALRPGGVMAHILPNARAPFAVLNRLLGHRWGRRVLYGVYPGAKFVAGFPSYYDRCTPAALAECCRRAGLVDVEVTPYYTSEYCRFFTPLYVAELARQQTLSALGWSSLCELFAITAKKPTIPCVTSDAANRATPSPISSAETTRSQAA